MSARSLPLALPALCAFALALLWGATTARADVFGTISMLSANPFAQAEYAHDPALDEDGNYVVFDGSVAGVHGIWRRETRPGAAFEEVAGGNAATLPSISADGRYISFTTNEGASLPSITDGASHEGTPTEAPSVYVRDMDKHRVVNPETSEAEFEPGAFTLASAKNHSTESLSYEFPGASEETLPRLTRRFGAVAAGRSAITADGRTVVFVTTAQSDLDGLGTPPLQVAVRHLDTDETELVSVRIDQATGRPAVNPETGGPEPVPDEEGLYGALASTGVNTAFSDESLGTVTQPYTPAELPGAAISADGSAVAWYGGQISEQARALSNEHLIKQYAEPLWRRIAGGPSEPTRRVAGWATPEAPGCIANPEPQLPSTPRPGDPCQGPFAAGRTGDGLWNGATKTGGAEDIPRLSANGDYVAFLASAPLTSEGQAFAIGGNEFNSDVYRRDMTAPDGFSGLRRLTQYASGETERNSTNANVIDLAISASGQQVAFSTRRTVFPLGEPAYVSVPAAVPGLVEMYEADLENETLTRVTRGYEGGQPEHPEPETGKEDRYEKVTDGSLSPSFGAGGQLLAFSSTASNLVFGDGNSPPNAITPTRDGADVFLVPRVIFSPEPTPQTISPAPGNPSLEPPWSLQLSATALANGTVRVRVRAPGAGLLSTSAASMLASKSPHGQGRKARRTVAKAFTTVRPAAGATVTLTLHLGSSYRALARRKGGLLSALTVTFTAKGHPTLRRKLTIRFVTRSSHAGRAKGRR